ncbi:MAG: hypothetical protein LBS59_08620 [Puniceicoccales bacterium]|nr:hypothetical protein [Puniceicoccales bacterium]
MNLSHTTRHGLFSFAATAVFFACITFFSGCNSRESETTRMMAEWNAGNYEAASKRAARNAEKAGAGDRLLWQLEWGSGTRTAGNFAESVKAFDAALASISNWDSRPDVSLSTETIAALNNMNSLPYRGGACDRIMLSSYQALNYLALREPEKARVALNLALARQREAVEANAERIEKTKHAATNAQTRRNGYDVNRANSDPQFASNFSQTYAETRSLRAYADYVNPFSVWLHGIFFLTNAADTADIEVAYKSLQRAAAMAEGNAAARDDLALAQKMRDGAPLPNEPLTYVIFETGRAPSRREVRIDIPLFFVARAKVPYAGAAFPKLQFYPNNSNTLRIFSEGGGFAPVAVTQTLASMDSVIATEFNNALPEITTRTLINAGIKAAISYGINEAVDRATAKKNNGAAIGGFIISRVATAAYSYSTTQADLRSWRTLPKEFQIARIPTPPHRTLRLETNRASAIVTLSPARINVVHVRASTAPNLIITQFPLLP